MANYNDYRAVIKEIPEYTVYYKDYYVKSLADFLNISLEDNFLQDLSDKVMNENPDIALTEPDYNVMLYMDGEFRDKDLHCRFCDAVTAAGRDCADYKFTTLEGATAVTVLHRGAYSKLGEAHAFAQKWIKENGYKQTGFARDSAIDGCWNRDSEEDYLMEVQIPVEKR
ncbi:GyrI-like domain-containing protein [Anaerovorax odorimutans]|uniref:GyrI-like domain-containing protein n=1 Tax=Anaerovorax odorimutans TaxID=109327 RepID=A0ABT1RPV0_9FIRM|nr:GyrI-like domain-containing protein [Anaerovorax odorimutans]MCQ4637221.1 GyrI-like domain-containing protein [Anaerovorax odorimutans]